MAVALDAQSTTSGGTTVSGSGTTGATCTDLTIGTSSSNYALVATCIFSNAQGTGNPTTVAAHWDSTGTNQAMTLIASQTFAGLNGTTGPGVYIFGLIAPTSGNKTFKVTWNAVNLEVHIYLFSFTGVNQTGGATSFPHTAGQQGTSATSLSATLTSATGNGYVVGAMSDTTLASLNGNAGYTQNTGPGVASGANYGSGAATVSLSVTVGGGASISSLCGVDIAAATATQNPFAYGQAYWYELNPTQYVRPPIDQFFGLGFNVRLFPSGEAVVRPFRQGLNYSYDLPATAYVPYRIEQTVAESFNVLLFPHGVSPVLPFQYIQQSTQLPPPPVIWYQSTTYSQSPKFLQPPFYQTDWPNPPPVKWYQDWNQKLGPFQLLPPFNQTNWPNPYPVTWYQTYTWREQSIPAPAVINPFFQTDWPLPYPVQWYRSQETPLSQPQNPTSIPYTRQQDFPNPYPVQWDRFWSQILGPNALQPPFRQSDYPNPQPVQWFKDWSQTLGPGALLPPFRQSDYPNPQPVQWYRDWSETPQTIPVIVVFPPINQTDWPNPQPVQWYRTWELPFPNYEFPTTNLPARQQDWQNPQRIQWYTDWYSNLLQTTLTPVVVTKPFSQTDWPLPQIPPFSTPSIYFFNPQYYPSSVILMPQILL